VYVAVPDSTTFTDRLYRWLARGGGHLNPFASAEDLAARIQRHVIEPLAAIRPLHTSFSFLNKRNHPGRAPRRLWLLGGGNERVLKGTQSLLAMVRSLSAHPVEPLRLGIIFRRVSRAGEPVRMDQRLRPLRRCAPLRLAGSTRRGPRLRLVWPFLPLSRLWRFECFHCGQYLTVGLVLAVIGSS
jgi:hypothetical protein